MTKLKLYYATNRKHIGTNRWKPDGYGTEFSSDGMENLRFGRLTLDVDETEVTKCLDANTGLGKGDGEKLTAYLTKLADGGKAMKISAFKENLDKSQSDDKQPDNAVFGSQAMFAELQKLMLESCDVLIYIHGFNVSWNDAVGSALALQEMLNSGLDATKRTAVVLFTWPSNGQALPFASYKSDRADALGSGGAMGRGILKLRDYLMGLRRSETELCNQEFHLLCHSMGNYVLRHTVAKMAQFTFGPAMPRIFDHVFMCSPDEDDNVLEPDQGLGRLHEITRNVTVYFNTGDAALHVSDFTKGNPERLGTAGSARPMLLHNKIHQIDCSRIVKDFVEHSYYLAGRVNEDIRMSIAGASQNDGTRHRIPSPAARNSWTMQ